MYQNIITDVLYLTANEPTSIRSSIETEQDRYENKWRNSAVFVYITPKDPANTTAVVFASLNPTYTPRDVYTTVPLNINMWNPIAIRWEDWNDFNELYPDYHIFLGISE